MPFSSPQITLRSLDAQRGLMPAALALFAVSLPIFVWVGAYAADAPFMAASLAVFAINCAAFYLVVGALEREPDMPARRRLRVHVLASLLWSGAVAQVAAFAAGAGPARAPLLMLACAAAVLCLFFLSPSLPALLIAGPAAAAGPLIALFADPRMRFEAGLAWGGFALAFLLMLILNRTLRTQFALAIEAAALARERQESLARAEALASSKSALVETLSREIRDGLAGLIQLLGAARTRGAALKSAGALDAARELAATLEAAIDSETASAGALRIQAGPFDAISMVHGLAALWRPQANQRGLEFAVFVDPALDDAGAAIADPGRVSQILAHLIANAIHYTVRGRIEVRIERQGAAELAISVVDTGPGLSGEEIERAFEPFGRVERTNLGAGGAGLGLSLSRELARLMGCVLAIHSAVGVGSCLTLRLPFDPDQRAPLAETGAPALASGPEAPGAAALKVLIIEANPLAAASLRRHLETLGHASVLARSVERATELLKAGSFDAVLLAPGEADSADGFAALRGAEAGRLVLITDGEAMGPGAGLAGRADAVLRRPVSLAALARALARPRRAA